MSDELFPHHGTQRVFQLHQLNKEVGALHQFFLPAFRKGPLPLAFRRRNFSVASRLIRLFLRSGTPLHAEPISGRDIDKRVHDCVPNEKSRPGPGTLRTMRSGVSVPTTACTPARPIRSLATEVLNRLAEFSNKFSESRFCHRASPVYQRRFNAGGVFGARRRIDLRNLACFDLQ